MKSVFHELFAFVLTISLLKKFTGHLLSLFFFFVPPCHHGLSLFWSTLPLRIVWDLSALIIDLSLWLHPLSSSFQKWLLCLYALIQLTGIFLMTLYSVFIRVQTFSSLVFFFSWSTDSVLGGEDGLFPGAWQMWPSSYCLQDLDAVDRKSLKMPFLINCQIMQTYPLFLFLIRYTCAWFLKHLTQFLTPVSIFRKH